MFLHNPMYSSSPPPTLWFGFVLLVDFAFADAPATQVLKPSETRSRLNAVGEMLTAFPPTSTVMEVLNVQGTSVLNVTAYMYTC